MMRPASLLGFAALFLLPQQALAFDCAKASTEVEKAICADPALKALDDEMDEVYFAVQAASQPKDQKMLARSQKRWIARRENCAGADEGTASCARTMTQERLNQLQGVPESGPGVGRSVFPVFVVQDGNDKQYDLDISLLRMGFDGTKAEKRFNAISDDIIGQLKLGPHGEDSGGSTYAQFDDMKITYGSSQLVSVQHQFWSDTGGAHGNGGIENFNIDMNTGKLLEIADMITEEGAARLAAECKAQIVKEKLERLKADDPSYDPAADDFIKDDIIAEHIATLSRWAIAAKEVTVSFDRYAVGSYAEGEYDCVFPMDEIREMAVDGAPLP